MRGSEYNIAVDGAVMARKEGLEMRCEIKFLWDAEAAVWIATSKDVPGLVLESGSFDALVERVKQAVPELLKLNHDGTGDYRLSFSTEREDRVLAYG